MIKSIQRRHMQMRGTRPKTYQRVIRLLDSPSLIKKAVIAIGLAFLLLVIVMCVAVAVGADMIIPEPLWFTASYMPSLITMSLWVYVIIFALLRRLFTKLVRPGLLSAFVKPQAIGAGILSRRPLIIAAVYIKYRTTVALLGALMVAGAAGASIILRLFNDSLDTSGLTLLGLVGIAPIADVLITTYRFKNGYFGDEREAREVVGFILANSEKIDLDDNGYRIFEPEPLHGSGSSVWSPVPSGQGQTI